MEQIINNLKANRDKVIERYNMSQKGISLKEYMNIVIWWFGKHPVIAKQFASVDTSDVLANSNCIFRINQACNVADSKANAAWNRQILHEHITSLSGGRGYWAKNYE